MAWTHVPEDALQQLGQGRWIFAISLAHWARRRIALASPRPGLFHFPERKRNRNRKEFMTTETTTHKLSNKGVEETLRSVIQTLIDGQEGFQKIGEHLTDETLRVYFAAESLKRAEFRGEVEETLHQEGVHDVREKGTIEGTVEQRHGATSRLNFGGGGIIPCWRPPKSLRTRRWRRMKQHLRMNCRCQSSNCSPRSTRISRPRMIM